MRKQLFVGLAVEGNTDMRFLHSVVHRTFLRIIYEKCDQDADVDVFEIRPAKTGKSFRDFVASASQEALMSGVLVLAIHADSDRDTIQERLDDKFGPAQLYLDSLDDNTYCKVLVPVIPMRMIEAWMLADSQLLKDEIGTNLPDSELGFHRDPEEVADPKQLIEEAIRKVQVSLPKKRRALSIGDLYEILGDKISIESLSSLASFRFFFSASMDALRKIKYLPDVK